MKSFALRFYECLGIRQFRRLAFWLEKRLHRKDRRHNPNYHLSGCSPEDLEDFIPYLYYNAALHLRSLLLLGLTALLLCRFLPGLRHGCLLLIPIAIQDLYCVMLQRYTWLRLRQQLEKAKRLRTSRLKRRGHALAEALEQGQFDPKKAAEALAFLQRLRTAQAPAVLTEADLPTLAILEQLKPLVKKGGAGNVF